MNRDQYKYFECGCCGHAHRMGWWGDCRNDDERLTFGEGTSIELDDVWPLEDQMDEMNEGAEL